MPASQGLGARGLTDNTAQVSLRRSITNDLLRMQSYMAPVSIPPPTHSRSERRHPGNANRQSSCSRPLTKRRNGQQRGRPPAIFPTPKVVSEGEQKGRQTQTRLQDTTQQRGPSDLSGTFGYRRASEHGGCRRDFKARHATRSCHHKWWGQQADTTCRTKLPSQMVGVTGSEQIECQRAARCADAHGTVNPIAGRKRR